MNTGTADNKQPILLKDILNKAVWGCKNPFGKAENKRWTQKTLWEWLHTPPAASDALRRLSDLAAHDVCAYKAEKQSRCTGYKGGLYAFQFAQNAKACKYDEAKAAGGALTGVYFVDVDHTSDEMQRIKSALLAMPACFAVGVSVSGQGLAAAIVYDTDGGEVTTDYMDAVFAAVCDYADEHLERAGLQARADRSAGNGVRWRICLTDTETKPPETELTPIQIKKAPSMQAPSMQAPSMQAPSTQAPSTQAPSTQPPADGETVTREARAIMFDLFDKGITDTALIIPIVRDLYQRKRPETSRLNPGEIERLVNDSLSYWEGNKKQCKAEMKKTKAAAAKMAAISGWKYDTFTGCFIAPAGERLETDAAAARIARENGLTLAAGADALAVYVRNNPENVVDSLRLKADALADAYKSDADAGAIQKACSDWGFDTYEARRFTLWMYELMARAFTPGEKCDCMILLQGEQGTRKTSLIEAISKEMTGDLPAQFDPNGGRDTSVRLAHSCIALIDEFDRYSRKADVAQIKAVLTMTGARERAAYARGDETYPYRAVFAGTTNNPQPLPAGESASRRYWVIEVRKPLDFTADLLRGMMREAAYDVREGLKARESADPYSITGRVWIATDAENAETSARNAGRRGDDDATLGLASLCDVLQAHPEIQERVEGARFWATAAETGTIPPQSGYGTPIEWKAPRASAAKMARLIGERCKRRKGKGARDTQRKNGYTGADILAEFGHTNADEAQTSEAPDLRLVDSLTDWEDDSF
jgi:hypothetical protein